MEISTIYIRNDYEATKKVPANTLNLKLDKCLHIERDSIEKLYLVKTNQERPAEHCHWSKQQIRES